MYSGPIIDPHMHLWILSMDRHPWLRPTGGTSAIAGLDTIRRDHTIADYNAATAGLPVVASVHIEALWDPADPLGEVSWLETLDTSSGIASRYVAAAPFGQPTAARVIEAHLAVTRVVGFRAVVSHHPALPSKSWTPQAGLTDDPDWRRDVARVAAAGATLDLMMYPYQTDGVVRLARAMPDLAIVIDHCGSPVDRDGDGLSRWRRSIRRLAAEPNVAIKVNMVGYDPEPTYDAVRDMAMHCIDSFGPDRAMFASDWPVSSRFVSYAGLYENFRRIAAPLSADEQALLFHDTAKRLYRA